MYEESFSYISEASASDSSVSNTPVRPLKMISTIVACDEDDLFQTLVEIGSRFIRKGMRVTVITPPPGEDIIEKISDCLPTSNLSALAKFRIVCSTEVGDIISWCNAVDLWRVPPDVILVNGIENFAEPHDVLANLLCSSLMDAVLYSFAWSDRPKTHDFQLIVGVKTATRDMHPIPPFLGCFHAILSRAQALKMLG